MTGIEQLRRLARSQNMDNAWTAMLAHELCDIADQIERERACDADAIENIRLIVGGVIDDMERHVSGVEGADDSPVARWARELRRALKSDTSDSAVQQNPSWHDPADAAGVTSDAPKVTRDPAEDVSMSAYDLLPADEREAIAWVREHGGLDVVEDSIKTNEWALSLALIAHDALFGEDSERDTTPTEFKRELDRRLMPEGMSWPVEDGEPVRIGDVVNDVEVRSVVFRDGGILLSDCTSVPGWGTWRSYKEPIKRPKVLDADGVEVYKGRIAYGTRGRKYRVTELCEYEPSIVHAQAIDDGELGDEFIAANTGLNSYQLYASKLTHRAPVLAADGKPLREEETVYSTENGAEFTVIGIDAKSGDVHIRWGYDFEDKIGTIAAELLTHERPDSWERLEEDAEKDPCDYFGFDGEEICGKCPASGKNCEQTMARDIVRRARALAERERGE